MFYCNYNEYMNSLSFYNASELKINSKEDRKRIIVELEKRNDALAYKALGYIYKEFDKEQAIIYFKKFYELGYNEALQDLGLLYHDFDCDEAINYYLQAINKGVPCFRYLLALCYRVMHDIKLTRKYAKMGIKMGNVDAYVFLAYVYIFNKQYDKAEQNLKIAIEKGSEEAKNVLFFEIYVKVPGKYNDAETIFLDVVNSSILNYGNEIMKLLEKDDYKDKTKEYIEKNINNIKNDSFLIDYYIYSNRFEKAIKCLEKSSISDIGKNFRISKIYENYLHDDEKATQYKKLYLNARPKEPYEIRAEFNNIVDKDIDKAIETCKEQIKNNNNKYYLDLRDLGELYFKKKDYKNAEETFKNAVEQKVSYAYCNLLNFYEKTNKNKEYLDLLFELEKDDSCEYIDERIGYYYYKKENNVEKARTYFLKAIEKKDVNDYSYIESFFREIGEYEPIIKMYKMMYMNWDEPYYPYFWLADLYREVFKDYKTAEYYLLKGIPFDRDFSMLEELIKLYVYDYKDIDGAVKICKKYRIKKYSTKEKILKAIDEDDFSIFS